MSRDTVVQELARTALRQHPAEAVPLLEPLRARAVADFLAQQDATLAADVLRRFRAERAGAIIQALPEPAATRIVGSLEPALAAALVARLPARARQERLRHIDARLAHELSELMSYPRAVAGSVMDPRVESFRPNTSAEEALSHVRTLRHKTIHDVFVVDEAGGLVGAVAVPELALADGNMRLDELAQTSPPRVLALAPQEELVAIAEDRRVTSVPVVDIANRLVGVIRYPELLRATQRDASADIQTMVGVSKEERALSTPWFAVRKRLPWLQINLGTAFLAASVVGLFEDTIARFTALAVLLPVVAGQSGNTGAQALAVTMRGLALREIRARHWFRVARKELMAGAVNGSAVAMVTTLGVYVWSQSTGLAAVMGVAMIASMIVAALAGASVPMALILLRQDPAAASSIVLTTITDVMGFLTFLGFATLASGIL